MSWPRYATNATGRYTMKTWDSPDSAITTSEELAAAYNAALLAAERVLLVAVEYAPCMNQEDSCRDAIKAVKTARIE
jgi:hypothetical protein